MHIHEIEEAEFRTGPRLWDADPDVCCAAFQLGACVHTESAIYEEPVYVYRLHESGYWVISSEEEADADMVRQLAEEEDDDCPF